MELKNQIKSEEIDNGVTIVVVGDTYPVREKIKEHGLQWSSRYDHDLLDLPVDAEYWFSRETYSPDQLPNALAWTQAIKDSKTTVVLTTSKRED